MLRVQCKDRVERQHGGEPAVTDLDARRAVLVHPALLPAAILALQRQERGEIAPHAQADCGAGEHAHGERERVAGAARALEDACAQERGKAPVQMRVVGRAAQEARGEEEEAFGRLVVPRAVEVGAVLEHAEHPVERAGELVSAPARVEEAEDVQGDDGVRPWTLGVKIRLPRCGLDVAQDAR